MRFFGTAVMAGAALALSACSGGDKAAPADSAAMAPAAEMAPAPEVAPAAGAMAPITGTTHDVKMIGDGTGYRYEPADITVKQGDGIRFTMVSGGPHNVAFDPATLPADVKAALLANMPEQQGELAGKILLNANETYTISFAGVPTGTYEFNCTPHLAMGMKGKVTVQ